MSSQTQAVLQVLTFLGTVALTGIGVLATIAFVLAGRRRIAGMIVGATATLVATYAVALVALGALGRDQVLGPGEAKVFCEIDCHLAYTVQSVRLSPTLPNEPTQRARGVFYVVTVRTHFDERTIAPWRGDGLLYPNPRRVRVVDSAGREWPPLARGTTGTLLTTALRPGESYETTLAFDVPDDIIAPRLELTEFDAVTRLLLGHENSPLHGKTLLALGRGFSATR